ncbi:MAG TPA: phage protease [Gallionellaceae bacterium]|nr:phage protease [Gallionellaceae bacterium]HQS76643.1 phage protease [Gallionellaceae bacterium]
MRQSRRIQLEAAAPDGVRRFVAELPKNLSLDGEAPQTWVTVTKIGRFYDPRYGEFDITRQMLSQMVDNFIKGTYGQDVFLDVSHEPSKGSAGKFLKLSIEGNKLRALIEWTPYGVDAVKSRGFKYLSADYSENFQDNEQRAQHGPLLFGAGLTIRPVIKGLDPVQLSEPDGSPPTFLHPELQTILLQEIQIMHKLLAEKLKAALAAIILLSEPMRAQLLSAFETAVQPVTDEAQAKLLMENFAASGKTLGEQIAAGNKDIKLSITGPTGLTEDDVERILAERAAATDAQNKKLTEGKTANIKLLSDTINAATGLDEATKKELSEAVADLITPEMTADQVKRLAENQIKHGNELSAAKQLSAMGFQRPAGSVHITVDSSNEVKSLQESVDKRIYASMPAHQRYMLSNGAPVSSNAALVEKALALYDSQNGHRLHSEYQASKRLAAGDSVVSDVSIPAIFERTVIREALSQLVGLGLCDVGTGAFAATLQLPYSYRDASAAGIAGARKFEGQAIARAAVKQTMEEARPIPQKLSFEVSDELRYLVGGGQLDFDIVADNARNATRIIGEDTEALIFNEHLNAADQYGAVAVVNEATATANGTKTIFCLDNFPVVRPKTIYDLQGNAVGSTLYPVVVKSNAVVIAEYDGTGTQAAGMYYSMNYNFGEITFVSELGVPVAPTNTHLIVASYTYTTNVFKWDSDLGGLATDIKYNDFLYRFGLRKTVIEDRAYMANIGIMSGSMRNQIEQAKQFEANSKRPGTDLMVDGNLGRIKDIPAFRSYAPGLNMGDVRTVIGERSTVRYRLLKAWQMGQLENQKDANGRFTGKKEAYGDQFVVVHTPTLLKGALTSMVVYSATTRVDR